MAHDAQSRDRWQKAGIIVGTIVIAFGMVWLNTWQRSVKYCREGQEFLSEGKLMEAITCFESAAHAYTPFNSHVVDALNRLWEIGERYEREKPDEPEYALVAFRSLRSSIYATRSFYTPHKHWIPRCDEKIKNLVEIQRARLEQIRQNEQEIPAETLAPEQTDP